jgi:hypothetical protein
MTLSSLINYIVEKVFGREYFFVSELEGGSVDVHIQAAEPWSLLLGPKDNLQGHLNQVLRPRSR